MSKATDFNDLAVLAGPDAALNQVTEALLLAGQQAAQAAAQGDMRPQPEDDLPAIVEPWPEPVLPGVHVTPDIPARLLPGWLGDMAAAVAASTQTPVALAVMTGIGVLATALQRRFKVSPYGDAYEEPLSIFIAALLASGNRKSAVFTAMTAPVLHEEKLVRDRFRSRIAKTEAQRLVAKKRIERLTAEASKAADDAELSKIRAALEAEQEAMPDEVYAPRLFTTNATAEILQNMLVEQGGRIAIMSDEGDVLAVLGGLYAGGKAALDVLLQGHAGSAIRVDRSGRTAHIDDPAVSVVLAIQPGTMVDLAGSKRFRDSGLLARFLMTVPASNLGYRDVRQRQSIPADVQALYTDKMAGLLKGFEDLPESPRVLGFSDAARELWLDASAWVETGLRRHGEFDGIADWAGKLPGAIARISGLLEVAETGLAADLVHEDTMRKAIEMGELLATHARAAFGLIGADGADVDAAAVVAWVQAQGLMEFSVQQCRKAMSGRFAGKAERLEAALYRLQTNHVLREVERPNPGARPSRWQLVNPACSVGLVGSH